jgi:hypothetical protein
MTTPNVLDSRATAKGSRIPDLTSILSYDIPSRCPECGSPSSTVITPRRQPRPIKGVYCRGCGNTTGDTAYWVKAARMMRDQDPRTPQGAGGVTTTPPTGGPAVAT